MTIDEDARPSGGSGVHHAYGWFVSMFCHVIAVGGVIVLMAEIEKPVLPTPFHWEVSVVQAAPTVEAPPVEPTPAPKRPMKQVTEPLPRVETIEPIQQSVRDVVTSVDAILERPVIETTESSTVVTPMTQSNQKPIVAQATSQPITHSVMKQEAVVEREEVNLNLPSVEYRAVQHRLVKYRQTEADYGWLRDVLWSRIEALKRYPSQAKINHWEGKVMLEVVIRDDGVVIDLHVAETSGHAILDQDAMAVLKKASPLTLKHPLGRRQVSFLIPISYRLDG